MVVNRLAVSVLLALALGQQAPPVLRGTWTATAAPNRIFRGTWSAQVTPEAPNTARGSWILLNDASQPVLEGTWTAQKSPRAWQGTWSARVVTGRSRSGQVLLGQPLSGTWQAALNDSGNKTLAEMLDQAVAKEVSGAWRSGRLSGNWWIRGLGR